MTRPRPPSVDVDGASGWDEKLISSSLSRFGLCLTVEDLRAEGQSEAAEIPPPEPETSWCQPIRPCRKFRFLGGFVLHEIQTPA